MITRMRSVLAGLLIAIIGVIAHAPTVWADTTAPDISNVQVSEVTDGSFTVTWETDEDADSLINYSLNPNYGIIRVPETDRTEHSVTIDELEPGRIYHFRVISSDEEGNQGISADYKIQLEGDAQAGADSGQGEAAAQGEGAGQQAGEADTTSQTPSESTTETQTESQTTQEIIEQINQITNPQRLQEILNETVQAIEGISEDLTIVGPPTVTPETTSALIEWTTDRPASSEVIFSPTRGFNGSFEFSQASTGGDTQQHAVRIIGLESFTDYTFRVRSTDQYGITGESLDYTFTTKASLPEIRNLRIVKVEENAATLAWDTTVPAKALVEYQDLTTGEQSSKGRPTFLTSHQMRIADLTLGTRYVAFVTAENAGGDRVRSQPVTFITVKDTAAPLISNVTNESTLFPGSEARIQTIVEWKTDEPAFCTMTYREGVSEAVESTVIEAEEISYSERHVEVIVNFAPATVYQFWLNCFDESGNERQSENFVLFTPIQEKNIIDLILENFESTFGWVQNIGG